MTKFNNIFTKSNKPADKAVVNPDTANGSGVKLMSDE